MTNQLECVKIHSAESVAVWLTDKALPSRFWQPAPNSIFITCRIQKEEVFSAKRIRLTILALALALASVGCAKAAQPYTTTIFAMNTVMTLTAYGGQAKQAVTSGVERIYQLERLLSATDVNSELYAANHSAGSWVPISEDTQQLFSLTLSMAQQAAGALDPSIYPVVQAWGFPTQEYRVPSRAELDRLLLDVDYRRVELDTQGGRLRLPHGMQVDLGSVAKGYAGDCLAQLFQQMEVDSAILDLGGNIQAVGSKPDGSPWRVGIRDPAGEEFSYLAVLEVQDQAVVTSGGYQRYFEQDGQTYWHILDPATGLPAHSGLTSVTVTGPSGAVCDALSTALFVMGPDRAAEYWRAHQDFDAVLVREDGSILITAGLTGRFSLSQGYEGREVTVIQP